MSKFVRQFRIDDPDHFRLSQFDPAGTGGLEVDKPEAKNLLKEGIERLSKLQERLYADGRWALLVILQGMDAAGKDSAIKHVMSGINPQGCTVHSFKRPSDEELDHDFIWRAFQKLPERGRIGIFNRSYYEEVLVVRVHQEHLQRQKIPAPLVGKDFWDNRFKDIRAFERYLSRNGIQILKFYLHLSKEEQKLRFLKRLDDSTKNWKFQTADVVEREHWDEYMRAYEDMLCNTSRPPSPWYVVPADKKWFTRIVIAGALVETLDELDLQFPTLTGTAPRDFDDIRKTLLSSNG